jgi:hypothetical protein
MLWIVETPTQQEDFTMPRHALTALSLLLAVFLMACGGSDTSDEGEADAAASAEETAATTVDEATQTLVDEGTSTLKAEFEKFGAALTLTEPTQLASLVETPESFVDKQVLIEGTVTGVCKGMGCWVEVKATDGASIIARSLDHSVSVPKDCEGRHVKVQGLFQAMGPPPAEMEEVEGEGQHEGEEGVEPHECPAPTYILSMDAVELGPASDAS